MDLSNDFRLLTSTRYDPGLLNLDWNTDANGGQPSSYLLLRFHHERLLDAAKTHGWPVPLTYQQLLLACDDAVRKGAAASSDSDAPLKLRILLDRAGNVITSATPVVSPLAKADPSFLTVCNPVHPERAQLPRLHGGSPSPPLLSILLDVSPTLPSSFTRTKTTRRNEYAAARERTGLPPLPTPVAADVLLYAPGGAIMETSIRNVALLRRTPLQWVTPRAQVGCLPGVMRRWLLEQGKVVEAEEGELMKDELVEGDWVLTFNGVEGCRFGRITWYFPPVTGSS